MGTTGTPTMTKAIDAAYKDHHDSHSKALKRFQADQILSREEIRLVELGMPKVIAALRQISGVSA